MQTESRPTFLKSTSFWEFEARFFSLKFFRGNPLPFPAISFVVPTPFSILGGAHAYVGLVDKVLEGYEIMFRSDSALSSRYLAGASNGPSRRTEAIGKYPASNRN
jgi:hypothetical protein